MLKNKIKINLPMESTFSSDQRIGTDNRLAAFFSGSGVVGASNC